MERERYNSINYLRTIGAIFGVKKIIYPGSGKDSTPEKIFDWADVTYLDYAAGPEETKGTFIKARYTDSDLPQGEFDAIFFKDNDAFEIEMIILLECLRPGGIVICDPAKCVTDITFTPESLLEAFPEVLKPVDLPFKPRLNYVILQKSLTSDTKPL